MAHHRPNLSAAYAVLSGAAAIPTMNLQHYRRLTDGFFCGVFACVDNNREYKFDDYAQSIASIFDGRMTLVESSLYDVDSAHIPMVRCVLSCVTQRMKAEDAEKNGITCVQANVFTDKSDNMWKLVGEGDNKELMQVGGLDDFAAILEGKKQRGRVVASFTESLDYDDGDYAMFFNPATAELDFGFVNKTGSDVSGVNVLSRKTGEVVRVVPESILEAALIQVVDKRDETGRVTEATTASPTHWRQQALAAGTFSKQAYLDYQRSLFGGTAFFAALEKALKDSGVR